MINFKMKTVFIFIVVFCLRFGETNGFVFSSKTNKSSTAKATGLTTPVNPNTTSGVHNQQQEDAFDPVANEAGAIIGVVFGVVLSLVFVGIAAVLYIRRKRERDRELMRSSKVQRVSTRSAGVYRDTTTEDRLVVSTSGRSQGAEYKSLQKHGYDDDSEEEL